jgi:hypothetical protein
VRLDGEQRLVLLGRDAVLAGAFLAERQEFADRTPEFAQGLKIGRLELRGWRRGSGWRSGTFRCVRLFQAYIQELRTTTSSLREDSPKTGGVAIVSYRRTMKSRAAGDVPDPRREGPARAPRAPRPIIIFLIIFLRRRLDLARARNRQRRSAPLYFVGSTSA